MDAYWRAANYLSVGQIYLLDNPLLREPLRLEHVKPRLLGHWGTTPGLNFIYVHLNRVITERDLDAIYVTGPGHGGPGARRQHVPRGHVQRGLPERLAGRRAGCGASSSSSPSPAASRATSRPRRPGSIHEGGELGYSLSHAFGAAFDNPDLLVVLRRRRRRGRDRPARDELALEQVPEPGARRRRAADPAPERLQDRRARRCSRASRARSSSSCCAATATRRTSSRATTRRRCTSRWPRRSTTSSTEIRASRRDARAQRLRRRGRAGR